MKHKIATSLFVVIGYVLFGLSEFRRNLEKKRTAELQNMFYSASSTLNTSLITLKNGSPETSEKFLEDEIKRIVSRVDDPSRKNYFGEDHRWFTYCSMANHAIQLEKIVVDPDPDPGVVQDTTTPVKSD